MSDYLDPRAGLRALQEAQKASEAWQEKIAGRLDAEDTFKYLMQRMKAFQANLAEDHEIGLQLANYGVAEAIHVRAIWYKNPNLIEFHGILSSGEEVALIQHLSQLNFLLIAVPPIKEEPYRIGFDTARHTE